MVRKQLYIEEAQNKALKRHAKELRISEAEVVRRALDKELGDQAISKAATERLKILDELFAHADGVSESHSFPAGYRFNRQELYEEDKRFSRYANNEEEA